MLVINDLGKVIGPALTIDGLVNCFPYGLNDKEQKILILTDDGKEEWVDAKRVGTRRRHLDFNRN